MFKLFIDGVEMPTPKYDAFDFDKNTYWSKDSGRSEVTGKWMGDLVGTKHSISIPWTNISLEECILIRNTIFPDNNHVKAKPSYNVKYWELDMWREITCYSGDALRLHIVSCGLGVYNATLSMIER